MHDFDLSGHPDASTGNTLPSLVSTDLESVFWVPARMGLMSAWWGHVPFAHWLVAAIRPRLVVELGTHNGVSFAAFCNAMQRSAIDGRSYAVDTWQGDEHAGHYDESVFRNLSTFIKDQYGASGELIRLTFDEAVAYFSDGSIDLLHIDGLHTYEAVKHDFENWRPKLSERAVVLFHDTNVREREFGVWKLWADLADQYPSFEFLHGHGLGVLAVGPSVPEAIADLCAMKPDDVSTLRERFSQLGGHWVDAAQSEQIERHAANLEAEREQLQRAVSVYQQHTATLEAARDDAELVLTPEERTAPHVAYLHELNTAQEQVQLLQRNLAANEASARHIRAENTSQRRQVESLRKSLARSEAAVQQVGARSATYRAQIEALQKELASSEASAQEIAGQNAHTIRVYQDRLAAVYGSTSWRVTSPLRALKQRGWAPHVPDPVPDSPTLALSDVDLINRSGLFDVRTYAGVAKAREAGLDPVLHYIEQGEASGLRPSQSFDPAFYFDRNPDLRGVIGNRLVHYLRHGRFEGRSPQSAIERLAFPTERIVATRETVVVAVHEATRTGASILGWNIIRELEGRYNVIALLKVGGPTDEAFVSLASATITLHDGLILHETEVDALVRKIKEHYDPRYIVANSVETRYFVPAFERAGIPAVALVHEFSANVRPLGALHGLFETASKIVFSARLVADAALKDYKALEARAFRIVPQGASDLPPENALAPVGQDSPQNALSLLPPNDGSLLVIGVGTITIRKGVEFFIAAAARVHRLHPDKKVVFAWVGKCYWFDEQYLDYLKEQIKRSGLGSSFSFIGEFEDLEPVYGRADLCFLSSRLDPLPNIAIDSAVRGIPVICFDQASGMAEILSESDETRALVVPYLDDAAAADLIVALADDPERRETLSTAISALATTRFDMVRYVQTIDDLGSEALEANEQVQRDLQVIKDHDCFNADLNLGPLAATSVGDDAILRYLHNSKLVAPRGRPRTGMIVRRPLEGFHPLIYAGENADFDEASGEDPLAHYARTGRPEGRWQHETITPGQETAGAASGLTIAVHGHFHYPELLEDFLLRLRRNETKVSLLLTTSSRDRAAAIKAILLRHGIKDAAVSIMPNRGRDIGPLLTGFSQDVLAEFDLLCHVHGKKSPHVDMAVGDTWRNFLWEHLVGGEHATLDTIAQAFVADPKLGLVFAEDPHLNDWDENADLAADLAGRMGLPLPLPNHIDFPQGTMFWARPQVLKPLQDLGLTWDDYPPEPLPIDGTSLHAIERLIPFCAEATGYRFATTYLKTWVR